MDWEGQLYLPAGWRRREQEGQVWEGALYAPQHKLSHLIAFLDYNHQQLDGYTKDICDLGICARNSRTSAGTPGGGRA